MSIDGAIKDVRLMCEDLLRKEEMLNQNAAAIVSQAEFYKQERIRLENLLAVWKMQRDIDRKNQTVDE